MNLLLDIKVPVVRGGVSRGDGERDTGRLTLLPLPRRSGLLQLSLRRSGEPKRPLYSGRGDLARRRGDGERTGEQLRVLLDREGGRGLVGERQLGDLVLVFLTGGESHLAVDTVFVIGRLVGRLTKESAASLVVLRLMMSIFLCISPT